jgi:hypothetical protein
MAEELKTYSTPGLKSIRAESLEDAALIFADRRAQRGSCEACVSGARDEKFGEFRARIVRSGGRQDTIRQDVNFIVYAEPDKPLYYLIRAKKKYRCERCRRNILPGESFARFGRRPRCQSCLDF